MTPILRVARPTDNLGRIAQMYCDGLSFEILGEFQDHDGFDGAILGIPNKSYHIEFTSHSGQSVGRAPTKDNLLVFYYPDKMNWSDRCDKMDKAGFKSVSSYNPYWDINGRTFEDLDGYRVVIQNSE